MQIKVRISTTTAESEVHSSYIFDISDATSLAKEIKTRYQEFKNVDGKIVGDNIRKCFIVPILKCYDTEDKRERLTTNATLIDGDIRILSERNLAYGKERGLCDVTCNRCTCIPSFEEEDSYCFIIDIAITKFLNV